MTVTWTYTGYVPMDGSIHFVWLDSGSEPEKKRIVRVAHKGRYYWRVDIKVGRFWQDGKKWYQTEKAAEKAMPNCRPAPSNPFGKGWSRVYSRQG